MRQDGFCTRSAAVRYEPRQRAQAHEGRGGTVAYAPATAHPDDVILQPQHELFEALEVRGEPCGIVAPASAH